MQPYCYLSCTLNLLFVCLSVCLSVCWRSLIASVDCQARHLTGLRPAAAEVKDEYETEDVRDQ